MIGCCVGIMAYNEAANIGRLLKALRAQECETVDIKEIIVVASGCIDCTEEIVKEHAAQDARIQLLRQPQREGKASAVNLLLRSTRQEVVILHSADTLPAPRTIEALVSPFADPQVGMSGAHPLPTNQPNTMMGYGVHLLWDLHHQMALHQPKMGELIAFRNIFRQIPYDSAVDEASIEPLIIGQGLRLIYVPEAIVYNKGPETVRDFLKQRRRIFAGHLYVKDMLGYRVSTMNSLGIAWLLIRNIRLDRRFFTWGLAIVALEVFCRIRATYDYAIWKRKPYAWSVAESTKELAEAIETAP